MGLNLNKINIATNRNNVLDIFFKNNIYRKLNTMESLAPSMDISSASNFERLVFDSLEGNGIETQKLMKQFKKDGFSIAIRFIKISVMFLKVIRLLMMKFWRKLNFL